MSTKTMPAQDADEPPIAAGARATKRKDKTDCDCGGKFAFDPHLEGETVGGLYRIGWLVCSSCKATCVSHQGRSAGDWKITGSGRSLNAEGFRVRLEANGTDPSAFLARLVRLPALETALRAIARGEGPAAELAARALEGS